MAKSKIHAVTAEEAAAINREIARRLRGRDVGGPKCLNERAAEHHLKNTLHHLERYRAPTIPGRRLGLPSDDNELIRLLDEGRRSGFTSKADRDIVRLFGKWRLGVIESEARAQGNIVLLLRAARSLSSCGHGEEAFDLLRFVSNEYRCHISEVLTDESAIERFAKRHSRRADIMSDDLIRWGDEHRPLGNSETEPEQVDFARWLR